MTSPLQEQLERYIRLFEIESQSLNGLKRQPGYARQQAALKQLQDTGFPTRKNENWKYTPALPILKKGSELAQFADISDGLKQVTLPEMDAIKVVLVNGVISESLSDSYHDVDGLNVLSFNDFEDQAVLTALHEGEEDAFALLNRSFVSKATVFEIKKGRKLEKPLLFVHLYTGTSSLFVNSGRYIISRDLSESSIIDLYPNASVSESFMNNAAHIHVGKGAHLQHYRLQYDRQKNDYVNNIRVVQQADSTYSAYSMDSGGKTVRNNLYTYHKGQNLLTNYYGVYMASERQHIDNQTYIDHAIPHCQSNELYKGILDDRSTGVFNGKVIVHQDAQKTNAFQQNSTLVLSPSATMNTKPQLEIFADDVKCSHGATVGQMDEDGIYYLRSRGLSLNQAKRMLQYAFVAEVLETFPDQAMRTFAEDVIRSKMG